MGRDGGIELQWHPGTYNNTDIGSRIHRHQLFLLLNSQKPRASSPRQRPSCVQVQQNTEYTGI